MNRPRPRFLPFPVVDPKDARFFIVLNYAAMISMGIHALFIPFFLWIGIPFMATVNVLSVAFWLGAFALNRDGLHQTALGLGMLEAITHASLSVVVVGWTSGFQYYLLLGPPLIYFSMRLAAKRQVLLVSFIGVLFLSLYVYGHMRPPIVTVPLKRALLVAELNVVCAFAMLSFLSFQYHQAATRAERRLRRANRRLEVLARTDPLTGLPNRRHMIAEIDAEMARQKRYGGTLALLLIDIDCFKQFNDSYGHEVGDKVLKWTAQVMRNALRTADKIARWGGEEFLVLLPETQLDGATAVAEKIRRMVANDAIEIGGQRLKITITAGIAVFEPDDDIDTCLARADAALRRGKAAGRNRVVTPRPV